MESDREVTANRPDTIIKHSKMPTDRCGNTCGQKLYAKGSRKENKYKGLCRSIETY
jgi:hypothetical protein